MEWVLGKKFEPKEHEIAINRGNEGFKFISEKKTIFNVVDV